MKNIKKKIIIRVKGGLGNQLFIYAFGYSLARKNNYDLHLDYITGFKRDYQYKRNFLLDNFNITSNLATKEEMMIPFDRFKRIFIKTISNFCSLIDKYYIVESKQNFADKLLNIKFKKKTLYIDGYWQSEKYFYGYFKEIHEELTLKKSLINEFNNTKLYKCISNDINSVFIHLRDFSKDSSENNINLNNDYYKNAISLVKSKIKDPNFYIFSEKVTFSKNFFKKNNLNSKNVKFISNEKLNNSNLLDFWLMQNCRNAIISNSTFSWWAAWMSYKNFSGLIVFPYGNNKKVSSWDNGGPTMSKWYQLNLNI